MAIRDDDGNQVDEGTVGQVHAQGPGVMVGYLNRDEATRLVMDAEGWLNTGDTGFLYQGELYLCGRHKDLIIINGRNHDPAVVEQALEGIEGVRPGCVAAFAATDSHLGSERLVVLCERSPKHEVDPATVEQAARMVIQDRTGIRLSEFKLLSPGTLPRTSSGKIRRGEARKRFSNEKLLTAKTVTKGLMFTEMVKGAYHHIRYRAEQLRPSLRLRLSIETSTDTRDVLIVGGGPAGLACAVALGKQGVSVHLVERCTWPVDKVCGEGLMPCGVDTLRRLGVFDLIPSSECRPISWHPLGERRWPLRP